MSASLGRYRDREGSLVVGLVFVATSLPAPTASGARADGSGRQLRPNREGEGGSIGGFTGDRSIELLSLRDRFGPLARADRNEQRTLTGRAPDGSRDSE
jgi:hypothetical protein